MHAPHRQLSSLAAAGRNLYAGTNFGHVWRSTDGGLHWAAADWDLSNSGSTRASGIAALKKHRVRQNECRLALGTSWQDHDLVFASEIGAPLDHNNAYHHFVALVNKTGVPHIPFHGLRHTHATLLMKHGVPPRP